MAHPRFLADADLRFEIVSAARRLEPAMEFQTARELGWGRIPDSDLLERAARQGLIVISHDVNTMPAATKERMAAGLRMTGLLLGAQNRATREIATSLLLIWAVSDAEEWVGVIQFLPI